MIEQFSMWFFGPTTGPAMTVTLTLVVSVGLGVCGMFVGFVVHNAACKRGWL